jgi:hypothetical protein
MDRFLEEHRRLRAAYLLHSRVGFVRGTLVHCKEGLLPIEELTPGTQVLSAPESGETTKPYAQVVSIHEERDQSVVRVEYWMTPDRVGRIYCSSVQPFWDDAQGGWTQSHRLLGDYAGPSCLQAHGSSPVKVWVSRGSMQQIDRISAGWLLPVSKALAGCGISRPTSLIHQTTSAAIWRNGTRQRVTLANS